MAQRLNTRPARRLVGAAAIGVGATLGLGGCANSHALALVRQACTHVNHSLDLYEKSTTDPSPAGQQADSTAALEQLRLALPLAATAAGENAQWQAFMTTLSESSRVPESDLVVALTQQCAGVAQGGQAPIPPATTSAPVPTKPEPIGR
jgi:hypothetical protein